MKSILQRLQKKWMWRYESRTCMDEAFSRQKTSKKVFKFFLISLSSYLSFSSTISLPLSLFSSLFPFLLLPLPPPSFSLPVLGEVIFIAPSYVTAPVEEMRDHHENKKKKKDKEGVDTNILPGKRRKEERKKRRREERGKKRKAKQRDKEKKKRRRKINKK